MAFSSCWRRSFSEIISVVKTVAVRLIVWAASSNWPSSASDWVVLVRGLSARAKWLANLERLGWTMQ